MKLIEVVAVYPPYRGGIGTVAAQNAHMTQRVGMDVIVATPMHPTLGNNVTSDEIQDGVRIIRLRPFLSYGNAAIMRGLFSILVQSDIIHLHYPFIGSEWIVVLAGLVHKKKIVVTYHMDLVGKGIFRVIFKIYLLIFLPLIVRTAKHIFVTSMDYAKHSKLKKYLNTKKELFSELPCSVDVDVFLPREKKNCILSRHGITTDSQIILFVGGLDRAHYFKGVSLLIQVCSQLFPIHPNTHLIIVGDGDRRQEYEQQSEKLGITERIHFAGSVSDAELPQYYACADVCTLPSVDSSEAFGIALIEALACGKPVVATDLPGVRSVVRHGVDGLLVAPSNVEELRSALSTLLSDEQLRARMGISARDRVQRCYSTDVVGREFISEITSVV